MRSNQSIREEISPEYSLDAKAETLILWPPDAKNWLIGKGPDAGKDWKQEEKGKTGDEMVGWHHWLNGQESEWTPGVSDGQGGLACCSPWGHKESDITEQLNWTEQIWIPFNVTLGTSCDKKIRAHYWGIISLRSLFSISEALLVFFFLISHTWEKFNLLSQLRCMIQNRIPAWVKIYIFNQHLFIIRRGLLIWNCRNGNSLQYSCLENSMSRGAWQAIVHGVANNRTWRIKYIIYHMIHILKYVIKITQFY